MYLYDTLRQFYSITSSARSSDAATREELKLLASKSENYVYVDDFYKLHSYIDQVTDVREGAVTNAFGISDVFLK